MTSTTSTLTKYEVIEHLCADCGASTPLWASVNRSVLVCDECVMIHRSFGRDVSCIQSITDLIPTQRDMVMELYCNGSNSIWEYGLLDIKSKSKKESSSKGNKKPKAKDPVKVKEEFIRNKYVNMIFINKHFLNPSPSSSSTDYDLIDDLSEQLHSSVRTPNLKTSLRLLASGADVNFLHPEKGNTPLHVAANSSQLLQVELLLINGADPLMTDAKGRKPIDISLASCNNIHIVERLRNAPFHLTDSLSHFVCGRRGNHDIGQDFIVPELASSAPSEPNARRQEMLQKMSNRVLQELVKDIYDEVDRRETNQMTMIPFLPVNSRLSSTRNQGRQKLATLIRIEFNHLITDCLREIVNRHQDSHLYDTLHFH